MQKYIIFFTLLLLCLATKSQDIYYQNDFNKGISYDFTLIDGDENPVIMGDFNNIITPSGSWFSAPVDTRENLCAMSTSHCQYDFFSDNWLITPSIHIESGEAWLKWDARSIHNNLCDGYKVMISVTDKSTDSFTEIFSLTEENYSWNTHLVSLKEYVGKDIYIAFVLNSKNKFLLAIDNLVVGMLSSIALTGIDETRRFAGDTGNAAIKGRLRNDGKTFVLKEIICKDHENVTATQTFENITLQPGEEQAFELTVPIQAGKIARYALEAVTDETSVVFLEDSIVCSYFPRKLVAEEYTGMWCNNCPDGAVWLNQLKARYKDEVITIAAHYGDPLAYNVYVKGLDRYLFSFPSFIYNRDISDIQNSMHDNSPLRGTLMEPTLAKVDLTADYNEKNISLATEAKVVFAEDYDNSDDTYRLGFALIEKEVINYDDKQKNSSSIPQKGEYYYMPNSIPYDLMVYHDVAKGTSSAFSGVENSLPEQIEAYKEYTFEYRIDVPETVIDKDNIEVIVFVLNTMTGGIMNADKVHPVTSTVNIHNAAAIGDEVKLYQDHVTRNLIVELGSSDEAAPYTINLINPEGKLLYKIEEKENSCSIPANHLPSASGCYLVQIIQTNRSLTKKIVLY